MAPKKVKIIKVSPALKDVLKVNAEYEVVSEKRDEYLINIDGPFNLYVWKGDVKVIE